MSQARQPNPVRTAVLGACQPNPVRTAVLGAGSFGTALALLLEERGHAVDLWARDATITEAIVRHRRNPRYLREFRIPESVHATSDLHAALEHKEIVLSVVPSHGVRDVWRRAAPFVEPDALIVSASKGIEVGSGQLVSEILASELPEAIHDRIVALSGPSFAREIAERRPTAVTVACRSETYAIAVQDLLSQPSFRCYSSTDVVGVELCGALKNVIAIAIGVADGMGLGLNARAALMTRGLAEITRLGLALGARRPTFQGLSGAGDLFLTCTGDLSRNRQVGLAIGRGEPVDRVLGGLDQVAEGVRTTRSAWELSQKHGVDMPITEEAYRLLYEQKPLEQVMTDLASRQLRSEDE